MRSRRLFAVAAVITALFTGTVFANGAAGTPYVFAEAAGPGASESVEVKVTYPSRGVSVPAVVTVPEGKINMPLVLICHGHGGDKNENVGLSSIAAALAKNGVASIRMDFPGCGESTEPFTANMQSNMKQDVLSALDYMLANYSIDPQRVGIFGYSMGGRISLELLADDAYAFKAVGLLAPAADTEDLKLLFGGAQNWEALKAQAAISGYAPFTTIYGQNQQLSAGWFADLEKYAGDSLIAAAGANYDGPALVIYAVDDESVSPAVSQKVANELSAIVVTTPEDGHGYGFYSDKTYILDTVVNSTASFFASNL